MAVGNGNASLAAARRYAVVTSTDYVQALLDKGRARALAENLPMQFQRADAEALPFGNGAGIFNPVTYIQRLHTEGGIAPTDGCEDRTLGQRIRVPYRADYRLFVSA